MVRPEHCVIVAAPLALLACSSWADHSEPNENGATLLWWAAQVILTCVSLALSMHYEWESGRGSLAQPSCSFVAATYVLRALFNSQETERLCMLHTPLASALAHRTFAALGESAGYMILLVGLFPRSQQRPRAARAASFSIMIAQALSFYGVITKSELAFVAEVCAARPLVAEARRAPARPPARTAL